MYLSCLTNVTDASNRGESGSVDQVVDLMRGSWGRSRRRRRSISIKRDDHVANYLSAYILAFSNFPSRVNEWDQTDDQSHANQQDTAVP